MSLKRIAVTGASGFVGGAAATALADEGHEVVGIGRRDAGWAHPRGRYDRLDLRSDPLDAITDAEVVVHAAAAVSDWMPWREAFEHNVLVTGRIVQHLRPGTRLINISSGSVYDAFRPNVRAREDEDQTQRFLAAYGASKKAAENVAHLHPNTVSLRPHAVYGPGDQTLMPQLLGRVRLGHLVLPAAGRVRHTVTHIDTLVEAIRLAIAAPVTGPINVGDAESVVLGEFVGEALRLLGRPARVVGIPTDAAMALASRAEGLAKRTGRTPSLTRYSVSQVGYERTYDLTRAHTELGLPRNNPSLTFLP